MAHRSGQSPAAALQQRTRLHQGRAAIGKGRALRAALRKGSPLRAALHTGLQLQHLRWHEGHGSISKRVGVCKEATIRGQGVVRP